MNGMIVLMEIIVSKVIVYEEWEICRSFYMKIGDASGTR